MIMPIDPPHHLHADALFPASPNSHTPNVCTWLRVNLSPSPRLITPECIFRNNPDMHINDHTARSIHIYESLSPSISSCIIIISENSSNQTKAAQTFPPNCCNHHDASSSSPAHEKFTLYVITTRAISLVAIAGKNRKHQSLIYVYAPPACRRKERRGRKEKNTCLRKRVIWLRNRDARVVPLSFKNPTQCRIPAFCGKSAARTEYYVCGHARLVAK